MFDLFKLVIEFILLSTHLAELENTNMIVKIAK
jgi:hypothetical protein